MNKKIALYFNEHFVQAAVNPFEGKFDLLRKEAYPLYFLSYDGQVSYGNYKDGFQKGEIGDIPLKKGIVRLIFDVLQVLRISGVGEGIQIENMIGWIFLNE